MKKKGIPEEVRRSRTLNVIMGCGMLFLAIVLARSMVLQLRSGRTISGIISAVGAVLFLGVAIMVGNDLRRQIRDQKSKQEEHPHGR